MSVFHVTCSENFQTVAFDFQTDDLTKLTAAIKAVRSAIKDATEDVSSKKKEDPNKDETPKRVVVTGTEETNPTEGQIAYLRRLGVTDEEIENIRSFKQASEVIGRITGTKLRKQN